MLTNCLSVFDHFVGLALKGLRYILYSQFSVIQFSYASQLPPSISLSQVICWNFKGMVVFFSSTSPTISEKKLLFDFVDFDHKTVDDLWPREADHSFLNVLRKTLTFHVKLWEINVHGNRPPKLKVCTQIKSRYLLLAQKVKQNKFRACLATISSIFSLLKNEIRR